MIVIINGPLGIGKSTAAWGLLHRFSQAVMLDGDYVAAFQPFDYYNQAHLDYAYHTFGVLAAHHHQHGITNIIVNWVLESPAQLSRLHGAIRIPHIPIRSYRLRCDADVMADRVRRRNLPDLDFELRRSRELAMILDTAAENGDLGKVIETTSLTVEQTVDVIWHDLQQTL